MQSRSHGCSRRSRFKRGRNSGTGKPTTPTRRNLSITTRRDFRERLKDATSQIFSEYQAIVRHSEISCSYVLDGLNQRESDATTKNNRTYFPVLIRATSACSLYLGKASIYRYISRRKNPGRVYWSLHIVIEKTTDIDGKSPWRTLKSCLNE